MNETQSLKKVAASVYICQVLTFVLAGFPLLIGVGINFYFKKEVRLMESLISLFNKNKETCQTDNKFPQY